MASEWPERRWGEIASLEYGRSLRGYESELGDFQVFGTNGPIGWHHEPLCKHAGVIVGRKGAYRGIHYSPRPFFVIDTAFFLEPKADIDLRWAYYELLTHDINSMDSGSAIPSTSRDSFYALPVRVPALEEQRAIARVLGTLDDKIELNRRTNETLEGIARALFKSWFVDFDPVLVKAEGHDTRLAHAVAELFPGSMQDSEMGEIPAGWHVGKVEEVAEINKETLSKNDPLNAIDYVEISEVMRGGIGSLVRYERGTEPSRARRRIRHGDTLLSTVRPDRGAYFLALNPEDTLIASTGFAVLTPKGGHWAFLYSLAARPRVGEYLARFADGGVYPAVRSEVIGKIPVALPPSIEPIVHFEKVARPLYEKADANRKHSKALAILRDTLLPKLISGEIRIPDAERIVGRQV